MYCWVDPTNNYVMVEVTIRPDGEEIIARLDTSVVDDGGFYMPLHYGAKVAVVFPGGVETVGVIVARLNDAAWPFPDSVCDIPAKTPAGNMPMFAFLKTGSGQLLAIETGDGGDVVVHSGGSVKFKADGGQLLLGGRTHIGGDFTTPPVGDSVGPAGEILPGVPGTPHVPPPGTNANLPPAVAVDSDGLPWPAEGLVRYKDKVQSNASSDPDFWAWFTLMANAVTVIATEYSALQVAANTAGAPQPWLVAPNPLVLAPPPLTPPASVSSWPESCSQHTCSDG
jgi:hypothetical protein